MVNFKDRGMADEFVLILPFTPSNKNNMIAWLGARCNPQDYGKIVEYTFPKQKLIFGPMQIESRIDQKPEISQAFTLWGQAGSKIIRGNLLIIPIKDSLIYVEPIYLQAEQGELPELKRVIVAYMDRIEIGLDLEDALSQVFGGAARPAERAETVAARKSAVESASINELIRKAGAYYNEAQQKLRGGDFAGYGDSVKKLGEVLEQLKQRSE